MTGERAREGWRSRIVGHGEEAPDQLLANPANWRIHPKPQQDALAGVLDQVGWVQDVIVNRVTGHVIDGHLRVSLAIGRREPSVPVVYVELEPAEESLILATIDPLAAMAATDREQLAALLEDVSTGDAALQAMLDQLAQDAGQVVSYGEDEEGRKPEDKLDFYENGTIRQIVLLYTAEEYAEISEILGWLRGTLDVDTNTDAITAVLRDYRATH